MIKQLSIFVENEVGSLKRITGVLKENDINIRAVSAFDSPDYGIMRVVVDNPGKAKQILTEQGFAVTITQVLAVELNDEPGALDDLLNILAEANLNLKYIYSFVIRTDNAPLMVFNIDNMAKAAEILRAHGLKVVGEAELHS